MSQTQRRWSFYARVIDALVPLINHLAVSEAGYNPDQLTAKVVLR